MAKAPVSQADLEHACALAADSLAAYCQLLWPQYKLGRHLAEIIRVLELVERGDETKGDPDRVIILCPPRHGKLCIDTHPVLTTKGWKTHGELQPGDYVFGLDGEPTEVVGCSPPGVATLEVEFTNGATVKVHPDHEWLVFDRARTQAFYRQRGLSPEVVLETRALQKNKLQPGNRSRYQLPFRSVLQMPERDLPIAPYFLGVWLGDGTSCRAQFCYAEPDGAILQRVVGLGYEPSFETTHAVTGVKYAGFRNVLVKLRLLGCLGNKCIPEIYKLSSEQQRLELLAGLIDTDGHVERETGRVRIATVSNRLRDDIVELTRGLGWEPYVYTQAPSLSTSGIQGNQPVHYVGFQPDRDIPTTLERKKIRVVDFERRRIGFKAIRECAPAPGKCIQVARPDGIYLIGRELIPTHNSLTVSQYFPSWFLGRNPDKKVIIGACAGLLAEDFGTAVRNNMQDPLHRMTFPRSRLSTDSQAKDKFTTTKGGQFFAVGRGSTTVGRGAHLFIVDDPVASQEEAQSEDIRRKIKSWFTSVAYTRLMPEHGSIVICQTLWHDDDLAGWLMRESEDNWKVIRYPAIAEEDEPWRQRGEALWPEQWSLAKLERIRDKSGLSTAEWMSLYQQRCVGDDGAVFKLKWFKDAQLDRELIPQNSHNLAKYILVDPANSKKRGSDYTAMWVVGLGSDRNVYILDGLRDKLGLRERANELFRLHQTWKPVSTVFYEEYGLQADIQYIRERQHGVNGEPVYTFNIAPVGGKTRKEDRIRRLEPWFRDGRIKMPRYMPRISAEGREYNLTRLFEEEYKSFPVGAHDDLFDCLARIADPDIRLNWPQTQADMQAQNAYLGRTLGDRTSWMSA